ncbi:MAG: sulfotransferase [Alphaproteobacteria bacterium]|nr:sulfotransferase [Alphaproteobacteria bacterium]MBL7096530.1 sulfotransferase [Alphaproteobacteria bacterium]
MSSAEAQGTVAQALAQASRLMAADPAKAGEQARAILDVVPGQPQARLYLGMAARRMGDATAARDVLEPLAAEQPKAPAVWFELGLARAALSETDTAIDALITATRLKPDFADAWASLSEQQLANGNDVAAGRAAAQQMRIAAKDPALIAAAQALLDNKLAVGERLLREYLRAHPDNVAALRMLAEIGARLGRYGDAEVLLALCLELAPGFTVARHNLAIVLHRQNKSEEAIAQIETLQRGDPGNPAYRALKGAAYGQIGEYDRAISEYEGVLKAFPRQPKSWMSYGHALKAVGRQADSVAAYRRAVTLLPTLGEAWWSLANLKTVRFTPEDVAIMRAGLARADLGAEDRYHLDFALGKAMEDARDYAAAFAHYAAGNKLRRASVVYDPEETSDHVRRSKATFTRAFFSAREGWGNPAPDPIFIVGLPRAGSTLLEQILATHSQVEGTMELPDVIAIARRLSGRRTRAQASAYPENLVELSRDDLHALGQEYLDRTRIQRKLGRPFFIDKMPNNFAHTGLIHLILPNSRIVDARRHPMGCCFSAYKQHFARGQAFSYDLGDVGRYYADYVSLMRHFDDVLPGRVHRVLYERMVDDPESEVRRLLDYCGLPFEAKCLQFYQNDRAVRTASSEQVRQPIFRDGVDQWQNFAPWLGPLEAALGPVLQEYTR